MNTQFRRSMMLPTIDRGVLTLAARTMFGLGGDYSNGQTIRQPDWPAGMSELVNSINRIDGRFAGGEDVFFYAGTAADFGAFLKDYQMIQGIEKHRLVLHRGRGETRLPSGGRRQPCDWKLQGCPKTSGIEPAALGKPAAGYLLEIHFWIEGRLALDQVAIPKKIEVVNLDLIVR